MPRTPPIHDDFAEDYDDPYPGVIEGRYRRAIALMFFVGIGIGVGGVGLLSRPIIRSVDPESPFFWLVGIGLLGWLIMWSIVLPIVVRDIFVYHKVRSHMAEPRCIFCGYDLKGHAHITGNYITCPECGKDSPRIAKTSTEASVA